MFNVTLDGPLGPQATPHRHVHRRRPRRRLPRRHPRARRHHARRLRPGVHRRQRRHRRRRPQRRRDRLRRAPRPRRSSTTSSSTRSPPSTASAPPCPRSRASARSSAPTATASAATVRRRPAPTGSTTPSSTPTASPRAAPRRRPTRSSSTAAPPRNGDLAVGDRTTVLTPEPVEVTVVGIATFGDVDSLGPTTYTAFTLDAGARPVRPPARTRISAVLVAAEDGVSQETLRDEITELMPARIEALTQARADRRAAGRHREPTSSTSSR